MVWRWIGLVLILSSMIPNVIAQPDTSTLTETYVSPNLRLLFILPPNWITREEVFEGIVSLRAATSEDTLLKRNQVFETGEIQFRAVPSLLAELNLPALTSSASEVEILQAIANQTAVIGALQSFELEGDIFFIAPYQSESQSGWVSVKKTTENRIIYLQMLTSPEDGTDVLPLMQGILSEIEVVADTDEVLPDSQQIQVELTESFQPIISTIQYMYPAGWGIIERSVSSSVLGTTQAMLDDIPDPRLELGEVQVTFTYFPYGFLQQRGIETDSLESILEQVISSTTRDTISLTAKRVVLNEQEFVQAYIRDTFREGSIFVRDVDDQGIIWILFLTTVDAFSELEDTALAIAASTEYVPPIDETITPTPDAEQTPEVISIETIPTDVDTQFIPSSGRLQFDYPSEWLSRERGANVVIIGTNDRMIDDLPDTDFQPNDVLFTFTYFPYEFLEQQGIIADSLQGTTEQIITTTTNSAITSDITTLTFNEREFTQVKLANPQKRGFIMATELDEGIGWAVFLAHPGQYEALEPIATNIASSLALAPLPSE